MKCEISKKNCPALFSLGVCFQCFYAICALSCFVSSSDQIFRKSSNRVDIRRVIPNCLDIAFFVVKNQQYVIYRPCQSHVSKTEQRHSQKNIQSSGTIFNFEVHGCRAVLTGIGTFQRLGFCRCIFWPAGNYTLAGRKLLSKNLDRRPSSFYSGQQERSLILLG